MLEPADAQLSHVLAFLRELWALDHALGSTSKKMHDRLGITAQQRMTLRFIGRFPGINARDLARLLHVERSTLSLGLKRLEHRKLIVRRLDPADRRRSFITLTREGRRFDHPTTGTVERALERALRASPAKDIETVRAFIRRLVTNLEE